MKSNDYLDLVKSRNNLTQEKQLATLLGTSPQAIHQIRNHKYLLNGDLFLSVAEYSGVPLFKIIADVHQEKARTPEAKKKWGQLAAIAKKYEQGLYIMLSNGLIKTFYKELNLLAISPNFSKYIPLRPHRMHSVKIS